jgi:mono/diheme cytochrome c family protein
MNKVIVTFVALMATVAGIALGADAKAGAEVYNKTCKGCHGPDGATPNEAVGKMLQATIPVLASPEFQAAKSDADIRKAITDGKGKMPAMKTVTGSSIDDVVAYVRSLKK